MKALICVFIIVCLLPLQSIAEIRPDHEKHIGATALVSTGVYALAKSGGHTKVESFLLGFGFALGLGLIKETMDDSFDMGDMGANTLGASVPILFTFEF